MGSNQQGRSKGRQHLPSGVIFQDLRGLGEARAGFQLSALLQHGREVLARLFQRQAPLQHLVLLALLRILVEAGLLLAQRLQRGVPAQVCDGIGDGLKFSTERPSSFLLAQAFERRIPGQLIALEMSNLLAVSGYHARSPAFFMRRDSQGRVPADICTGHDRRLALLSALTSFTKCEKALQVIPAGSRFF